MDRLRPPRDELASLVPYAAKLARAEIDLSANENPRNLPGELLERLRSRMRDIPYNRYPDPMAEGLRELIARANGLEPANILVGNGGDELLLDMVLAWGGPGRRLLTAPPTFVMYEIDARMTGTEVVAVPRREDFSVDEEAVLAAVEEGVDIVMLSNPNNPTGTLTPESFLMELLDATDALVVVDEAYFEFSRHTMRHHMPRHKNLVILRTFSKAFSLAGLRVGYLLAHEDVVLELTKVRQPYSVNSFSQMAAATVFNERAVFESAIDEVLRGRDFLGEGLGRMAGVEVFPSDANFILFRVEHASALWRDLLHEHSILVRDFSRTPYLEDCLRVTVGTPAENEAFIEAMDELMARRRASEILGMSAVAERHQNGD
ncbi:MAG: histidinol-phosphate transaminase [Coriobacteriia bacterium]